MASVGIDSKSADPSLSLFVVVSVDSSFLYQ